jgi:hypothetical protein
MQSLKKVPGVDFLKCKHRHPPISNIVRTLFTSKHQNNQTTPDKTMDAILDPIRDFVEGQIVMLSDTQKP